MEVTPEYPEESGGVSGRFFVGLVVLLLIFGASIGGAYALGSKAGRSQAQAMADVPPLASTVDELPEAPQRGLITQEAPSEIPPEILQQMRAQGVSEEEIQAARIQLRAFEGQGFGPLRTGINRPSATAREDAAPENSIRLTGAVQSIEDSAIVVMTPDGPQRIGTIAGTRITITFEGGTADLTVGDTVNVLAVPGPEPDTLEAATITSASTQGERQPGT